MVWLERPKLGEETSVVDPKLNLFIFLFYFSDPDPALTLIPDSDPDCL